MKNSILALSITTFTVIALSSCGKCQICVKDGANEVRVCEKNYDSNTAYGLALDYYEGMEYTCR